MTSKYMVMILSLVMLASVATAANSVVLLIDNSGSMDDSIGGGQTKMDAAKAAANNFLNGVSSSDEVALIVFHDCNDIVVEQGFTRGSFSSMKSKINALDPDGGTPISCAIKEAAEYAYGSASNSNKAIILLTDGQETCTSCWGGPDDAALEAHTQYGVNVIHVVGFDISPGSSTEQQLQQVASSGGGNYYPADDANQLNQALTQAYTDVNGGGCCCTSMFVILGGIGMVGLRFFF